MADNPLSAAARLARLGAEAYVDGLRWGAEQSLKASSRVVRAAAEGESLGHLLEDAGTQARDLAREVLGVAEVERKVEKAMPATVSVNGHQNGASELALRSELRQKGAELLERSADVHADEPFHPAYARILDELAPDEARVLRFLAADGAQPALDVRTFRPLDIGSQLIAPGLQMIGAQAGVRYADRVPAYLNNLYRLGLIWFSREPLGDPLRYQVLEAQPDVLDALKRAGRGKTVRRSIDLTPFGKDFCRTCLPPMPQRGAGSVVVTEPTAIPPRTSGPDGGHRSG